MDKLDIVRDDLEVLGDSNSHLCSSNECYSLIESQNKQIKIFHMNIRSISRNFNDLLVLLAELRCTVDVIILTECWLSKISNIPSIPEYNSYFSTVNKNQNDGVVIYVKNNLKCLVEYPTLSEGTCLVCKFENDLAVVAIYRSPSYATTDIFVNSLNLILSNLATVKTVAVLGDINIDILQGNSFSAAADDYLNMLASLGYLSKHFIPTHGKTCYDHVMLKSQLSSKTFVINSTVTDHFSTLICIHLSLPRVKHTAHKKCIDFESALNDLRQIDFSDFSLIHDPNVYADLLISKLSATIENNTTTKNTPRRKRTLKPWISIGLLKCIRNRDKLHQKVQTDPTNEILKLTYTRYRNFCRKLLNKLKRIYETNQFEKAKNDPKATWEAIKKVTHLSSKSVSSSELLQTTENPIISANSVNKFFATVGESLAKDITDSHIPKPISLQIFPQPTHSNSIVLFEVENKEIENIIMKLKNNCSAGWDGISVLFLKSAKDILIPVITQLCNLCITEGVFPNSFKKAVVHPIYKGGGDQSSVGNYRPISVLNILSKILEKVLNKRLLDYLEHEKILSDNQYGFRKGKSTEDAVLRLTETVSRVLDKKKKCAGIFIDLKKAFDTVSIPLLLKKLEDVGVRGTALNIFSDYLTNRTQCVKINNITSESTQLSYGVPQGSVLGPTLFLVYLNQLCQLRYEDCTVIAYADDTAILVEGNNWQEVQCKAEKVLNLLMTWLTNNLLTLNISKTTYVTFSVTSSALPLQDSFHIRAHVCSQTATDICSCASLTRSSKVKYLGVLVDETLSWQFHIQSITSRSRKLMYVFKLLRNSADTSTLKMVYYALAQSILSYCIPAWGGSPKTTLLPLERAQRAVIKVINKKHFRYPTDRLYAEYEVLTIRQLFVLQSILRTHVLLKYNPALLSSIRRKDRVCDGVAHRTSFAARQCYVLGPRLYNRASRDLNLYSSTRYSCKTMLTAWLKRFNYDETENLINVTI